jgi:hypothetical protein
MKKYVYSLLLFLLIFSANAQKIVDIKDLPDGWNKVNLEGRMVYDGEIFNGMLDGEGLMTWADGSTYSGLWVSNMRDGKGTMKWPNGNVYMGMFKNDEMNGKGTLIYADQHQYAGKFKDGVPHGSGKFISTEGKVTKCKHQEGKLLEK